MNTTILPQFIIYKALRSCTKIGVTAELSLKPSRVTEVSVCKF